MGDTTLAGTGGGAHAVEARITDGPANAVHRRASCGRALTELCDDYGVSRKTGYKWIERYLRHGPAGLEERSQRPRRSPNQTAEEIVTAILEARHRHPFWG